MSEFSAKLREKRKESGLKVKEVLEQLNERGVKISDKTLYNWETGERKPDADEFVTLCKVYGVKSFKEFECTENEKSPAPEGTEEKLSEADVKLSADLRALLEKHGLLSADGDITAEQGDILFYTICLLRAALKESAEK